jgi:curved DNA-binding protein CbpA
MTEGKEEEAARILRCMNHFEVLELDIREHAEESVRKQFRQIALLVHPDKCLHPGKKYPLMSSSLPLEGPQQFTGTR